MHRKANIELTGLRWSTLEAQHFYYIELSREAGLLCTDKKKPALLHIDQKGGSVSKYNWVRKEALLISVGAVCVGVQSSGHKHGRGCGGYILHTVSISIHGPEVGFAIRLSFTPGEKILPFSHVWYLGPWHICACVNNKHSLRISFIQGFPRLIPTGTVYRVLCRVAYSSCILKVFYTMPLICSYPWWCKLLFESLFSQLIILDIIYKCYPAMFSLLGYWGLDIVLDSCHVAGFKIL